jgi:hypothetical protein
MTSKLRKAAIGALAVLTLGAGVMATATPSAAQGWRGGYRWHTGNWYRGYYGWGAPVVAAGVIGGLALGALAATPYAYGPLYYGGCTWQNRPVYDSWGNFAGYAPVQACY